jgi:hypothetical protein
VTGRIVSVLDHNQLKNLKTEQLFTLALYTVEYNVHFFLSWSNRLRPYDQEPVNLLEELARDAGQYRQTLHEASQRIFPSGLPELDQDVYRAMHCDLDLPDARYFVINDPEVRSVLDAALSLQKNAIELLKTLDEALHRAPVGDISPRTEVLASQQSFDSVDETAAGFHACQRLS